VGVMAENKPAEVEAIGQQGPGQDSIGAIDARAENAAGEDRATLELLKKQLRTDALRHVARLHRAGMKADNEGLAAILKIDDLPPNHNELAPRANGHKQGCNCNMCKAIAAKWRHKSLQPQPQPPSVRKLNLKQRRDEILRRFADPSSPTFADATASAQSVIPHKSYSSAYEEGRNAIKDARSRILGAHSRAGITDDVLAQKLAFLLNAEKTEYFAHQGVVIEERKVAALNIQLGALELGHKLRGEMPKEEPEQQASLIVMIDSKPLAPSEWEVRADAIRRQRIAETQAQTIEASVSESAEDPSPTPTTQS
jgi:hypothetical protein